MIGRRSQKKKKKQNNVGRFPVCRGVGRQSVCVVDEPVALIGVFMLRAWLRKLRNAVRACRQRVKARQR